MTVAEFPDQQIRDRLYDIVREDDPFEEKAQQALALVVEYLDDDGGYVSRIDEEMDHWEAITGVVSNPDATVDGEERALSETYCRRTTDGTRYTVQDAPNEGLADDPAFAASAHHSYLGIPLILDDELYGTVCFFTEEPREVPYSDSEIHFVEQVARLLERELARSQVEAELTNQTNLATVLNRVLRHNLRNDMSVIRGFTTLMADELETDFHSKTVLQHVDELLELSDKAGDLNKIVSADFERTARDVTALVEDVLVDISAANPTATYSVTSDEQVTAAVLPSFERAVEELVENAIKHGGDDPTLSVSLRTVPNAFEVEIADDGPGLSEQEIAVIRSGEETPLTHGSGLGLWLAYWIVTSHDGTIDASVTDEGTVMTITVPRTPTTDVQQQLSTLTRARDQYEAAFDEAYDAMIIVNDDGTIVNANPAATEIFGLDSQELLGRSRQEFLPDDFDTDDEWKRLQTDGMTREIVTIKGEDGVERTVQYSATANIVPGQHLFVSRDITGQREREAELEETSRRLSLALEGTETGVWEWDLQTDQVHCTESMERLFGLESGSCSGSFPAFAEKLHPEDRQDTIATITAAAETNSQFQTEYRIPQSNGTERWVHSRGEVHGTDDGPGRLIGVVTDITDRKQRERDLDLFKKAVESSSHSVYITDLDGTISYVNPAFESITGYASDEAIGQTPRILNSGEHDEAFYEELWETILAGESWRSKMINTKKNGEQYIVDQTISPISNTDGAITSFVAVNTDITEREERKRTLQRYKSTFEDAGDGMTITDDEGRIRDVNDEAARIYDEAKEQLIGRSMREFLPNDFDFEAEWGKIQAAKMKRDEMPIVSADGGVTSIEYTAVTDVVPGQHLIVSRDISDRKTRERQLERDVERLDQFASVLSHDLRNPLNVAQTRLELASSEYESKHFEPIERAHGRMETLIEDLLTLARQGPEEADFEPIELSTLASDCWGTVQSADATLEIETDHTIEADSNRLKQLFENLFSNAVHHGGDDVTVTVVQLDSGFAVEDDGPGIPVADRDQVFEAGFSSDQEGTGFGLSIAQQAARAHGWDLTVTDGSNGGARFEITSVEFVEE